MAGISEAAAAKLHDRFYDDFHAEAGADLQPSASRPMDCLGYLTAFVRMAV